ncbi:MAG: elongation factor G, partial [Pirellulaceae bacterium]|nr:elongation factor G [Pirellulaceae bacterium]
VMRDAVLNHGATPVFLGTAFKNKGVQLLLDAVLRYLPSPMEREVSAIDATDTQKKVELLPDENKPFVGMAFKIVEDPFGQLTYTRIYQGKVEKGNSYYNQRTGKKDRFSRIVRMHSDKREELDSATAGDIVAIMGIDCASGDTYCNTDEYCTLENIFVAEPVIKIAVAPKDRSDADKMSKALQRFRKEDPTFHVFTDEETNEVIIAGMGELHLEVYVERIRREYKVDVEKGAPKVSYRETLTQKTEFNYKHKKQSGGAGQFAHIVGYLEPLGPEAEEDFVFEQKVVGGRIPKEYIPAVEKGFRMSTVKGPLAAFPVVGVKAFLEDGSYHDVDSSEMAFQICSRDCFRDTFKASSPVLLEPIMKVEIECPEEFQGAVVGNCTAKRGIITSTSVREDGSAIILADVPLAETFGYATELRSMTQGQGTFSMELSKYSQVPRNIQEEIIEEHRKAELAKA